MCVDNIDPCVCIYACSSAETFLPSLKSPGRGDGGHRAGQKVATLKGTTKSRPGCFGMAVSAGSWY